MSRAARRRGPSSQVFTCGPLPFMRHVRAQLLARGVPAHRIRYEVFGPDLWAAQLDAETRTG